jgi:hypothetical protein
MVYLSLDLPMGPAPQMRTRFPAVTPARLQAWTAATKIN